MTCNDCIHCEACISQVPRIFWDSETFYDGCKYFKDKSRFIELPCKVGDTVYSYDEDLYALLDYRINQITLSDGAPTLYSGLCFNEDELLSDIDFVELDIGKTVFLTREEAEKALKECKRNV